MGFNLLDWFGYIASLIILVSLLNSSIIKLRWTNMVGALLFSIYGVLIGSLPVAVMNGGIVLINIYYLIKIYSSKEYFHLLELKPDSNYFEHFIEFFKEDIEKYFGRSDFKVQDGMLGFYILRNMVTAGVFIASVRDNSSLNIEMDYAVAEYRDFKIGKFVYGKHKDLFLDLGYDKLYANTNNESYIKYLTKMDFVKTSSANEYLLSLK